MGDRDRPSWREIDRRRDGGYRRERRERSGSGKKGGARISRAELDRLFETGQIGEVVRKMESEMGIDTPEEPSTRLGHVLKAMRIEDDRKFSEEASSILKEFGPPPHEDFLLRVIEVSEEYYDVLDCAQKLLELAEEKGRLDATRTIRGALMLAEAKFMDPELSEVVRKLLKYA